MKHSRDQEAEPILNWQDCAIIEAVKHAVSNCTGFPSPAEPVEVVQTHISTVFLTSHYVFKFKRPLNMGFTDFRTLRQRRHFCREEIRLNRRLANGVYLDILALWSAEGSYCFEGGNRIVDYAVVMKRLEPESMMDYRVTHGLLTQAEMTKVARRLARFHARARRIAAHTSRRRRAGRPVESLQALAANWEENFQQVAPYANITISEADSIALERAVFGFVMRNREQFERRERNGFIVDGHGDLKCEHIYLGESIKIIDCIEFNKRFRIGDVASDIAFLLMDLAALGHPEWSRRLLSRYIDFSGDRSMAGLAPFYCCYRAFVRGKVLSMKLSDKNLGPGEQQTLLARARSYFQLAMDFSQQMAPPVLLVMAGLMGTGKSDLAGALARRTGAALLSSDRIRKELAAEAAAQDKQTERSRAGFGQGIYTDEWHQRTYGEMFRRASDELAAHRSVILDASFSRRATRNMAFELARQQGAEAYLVECILPDAVIARRLAARQLEGNSISEGRLELLHQQKAGFEQILEAPPGRHLLMRTERPVEQLVEEVLAHPGLEFPSPLFSIPPRRRPAQRPAMTG